MNLLLIDNYDSFTHMLADYIRQCNVNCMVTRNDDKQLVDKEFVNGFDGIVLSPGPGRPEHAGFMMYILANYSQYKPMLGVCLGHQAIGVHFGATLGNANLPRHGKVDEILHDQGKIFNNVPEAFKATRYHSLILKNVSFPLKVSARTTSGNDVMALEHTSLPLWGIQFHPESCLTKDGITIIKNYIELVKQRLS